MKHLDVLPDAGLIVRAKTGGIVPWRLDSKPMERAMGWRSHREGFWSETLERLAAFVEDDEWHPNQALPATPVSSEDRASPSNVVSMPRRPKSTPRGPTRKK